MNRVVLIEKIASLQILYEAALQKAGYDVISADNVAQGMQAVREHQPSVILLELMLPDAEGKDLVQDCLLANPNANIIAITANGSINRAVQAMRSGAYEFLVKPFDEAHLLNAVRNAARDSRRENGALLPELEQTGIKLAGQGAFIGTSPVMLRLYTKIQSVARSMATIFITGESGAGKEICARALHEASDRSKGPFVPLNCGAIPDGQLESEVFGYLKGAFPGAITDKHGAAALADRGTLFLDEVCEMNLNLQTKLLSFLQTSTIRPVGQTQPHKVDVRIICATNRDPLEEVRNGRFRADLFYRLHVIPMTVPPLRDRGDDVVEIAEAALHSFSAEEGKTFIGLSEAVKQRLQDMSWPGNVRQLMNVIRNIVVLNDGPWVTPDMLPMDAMNGTLHPAPDENAAEQPKPQPFSREQDQCYSATYDFLKKVEGKSMADIERLIIEATIERNDGSVTRSARDLDLSPSTIYRKREAWNTQPK